MTAAAKIKEDTQTLTKPPTKERPANAGRSFIKNVMRN